MVFPVALPRTIGALRFASFFSLLISIYIAATIFFLCLIDRDVNPNLGKSFRIGIENFNVSVLGVFNSIPLVIFAYMYQTNVPMLYVELEKKDLKDAWKINNWGVIATTIIYLFAGIFGYVTFAAHPNVIPIMENQNIL